MKTEAYGAAAVAYAAGLDGVSALVADATAPAQALAASARLLREGCAFWSCVLVDDPRAALAYEYAEQLLSAATDDDQRRRLFDGLAAQALTIDGVAQTGIATLEPAVVNVLRDVSMMGEGLLVRSWAEANRLAALFGRRRESIVLLPGIDSRVPGVRFAGPGETIVVWAPGSSARRAAIFAYALKDFHLPVTIACEESPPPSVPGHVRYAAPGPEILERAAVVVDVSIGGPETAIALACGGFPLAASVCSGAAEYVSGAAPYEPWNWRSIHAAVLRALAGPPARVSQRVPTIGDANGALAESRATLPREGPLVTVIVPTYNRRGVLPRALDSLERQWYRSLDIAVINDGGEDVADIVARYPNARLISNPRNLGITETFNAGLRAVRGEYVAFCDDDDTLYPEAIARWVRALSRSPARIAHGNTMMRFERTVDGVPETYAYRLIWKESVEHRDSLFAPTTAISCCMLHRSVIEELGYYEESPVNDVEYQLRISRRYDYVHVDHPCIELNYDPEKGQGRDIGWAAMAQALARTYERYPTTSGDVAAGRQRTLDWYARCGEKGVFHDPDMLLARPERP